MAGAGSKLLVLLPAKGGTERKLVLVLVGDSECGELTHCSTAEWELLKTTTALTHWLGLVYVCCMPPYNNNRISALEMDELYYPELYCVG